MARGDLSRHPKHAVAVTGRATIAEDGAIYSMTCNGSDSPRLANRRCIHGARGPGAANKHDLISEFEECE